MNHRRQAVGDDDGRAAGRHVSQVLEDRCFGEAVQHRCRFIEHEDVGALEDCPCNRDSVALTTERLRPRSPTSVSYPRLAGEDVRVGALERIEADLQSEFEEPAWTVEEVGGGSGQEMDEAGIRRDGGKHVVSAARERQRRCGGTRALSLPRPAYMPDEAIMKSTRSQPSGPIA
jgi:hypothetical protein